MPAPIQLLHYHRARVTSRFLDGDEAHLTSSNKAEENPDQTAMTFEDDILGPNYTDLDFTDYVKLYDRVVASEPRAVLDLDFLNAGSKKPESDDEEGEGEEDDEGLDGEELDNSSSRDEAGVAAVAVESENTTRDLMDLDDNTEEDISPAPAAPSKTARRRSSAATMADIPTSADSAEQESSATLSPTTPQQPVTTTQQQQCVTGFPPGLEHYFAVYLWTLLYFQDYTEAAALCKRYRSSLLFGVSPLVTASVRSARYFCVRSFNDTPAYTAIYQQAQVFSWGDPKRGGSKDLAQLVKGAIEVVQKKVYEQLRDKFTRVHARTVAAYLPVSNGSGDRAEEAAAQSEVVAEDVLSALNSVDPEWTQDADQPALLIPPPGVEKDARKESTAGISQAVRRQWLNELVNVASELESKSLLE